MNLGGRTMATFVEYEIEDGFKVLVKLQDEQAGLVEASNTSDVVIVKAENKFGEALESVHRSALVIKNKLENMRADEVEVKFGLTTTGKLGNFAIGEVGVNANYEITLKWKNSTQPKAK